jgi:hypothetical protein
MVSCCLILAGAAAELLRHRHISFSLLLQLPRRFVAITALVGAAGGGRVRRHGGSHAKLAITGLVLAVALMVDAPPILATTFGFWNVVLDVGIGGLH